jgi:hypothetical protein
MMNYDLRSRHACSLPGAVVQLLSQSPHLHAYTPKVSSALLPKTHVYPLHFPLRFSLLARVILDAVSNCWFREFRRQNGVWTGFKAGMLCTAGTCSPRISGVAAMAGVDVNQPRAKANTTAIKCLSCCGRTTASGWPRDRGNHRRPAGQSKGATRRL